MKDQFSVSIFSIDQNGVGPFEVPLNEFYYLESKLTRLFDNIIDLVGYSQWLFNIEIMINCIGEQRELFGDCVNALTSILIYCNIPMKLIPVAHTYHSQNVVLEIVFDSNKEDSLLYIE